MKFIKFFLIIFTAMIFAKTINAEITLPGENNCPICSAILKITEKRTVNFTLKEIHENFCKAFEQKNYKQANAFLYKMLTKQEIQMLSKVVLPPHIKFSLGDFLQNPYQPSNTEAFYKIMTDIWDFLQEWFSNLGVFVTVPLLAIATLIIISKLLTKIVIGVAVSALIITSVVLFSDKIYS